jgi:hypothetical protein
MLDPGLVRQIKAGPEQDVMALNSTIGMALRNLWGLWNGSQLRNHFRSLGIRHPDDMTALLLITFWYTRTLLEAMTRPARTPVGYVPGLYRVAQNNRMQRTTLGGHLKTGQSWTGQNRPLWSGPRQVEVYRVGCS